MRTKAAVPITETDAVSKKVSSYLAYLTKTEWAIWLTSIALVTISFFAFDRAQYLGYVASLLGVTALMLSAKGNPIGQVLVIVFSGIYAYLSYEAKYYGEMITYLGMTAPMAVLALVSWLKHPYEGDKKEVQVGSVSRKEAVLALLLNGAVTAAFYFILRAFGTANLFLSTISVATSFSAVYLTFRRSEYFALAYMLNDIVLISLWSIAAYADITKLSMVICFLAFLLNDAYTIYSWRKMRKRQKEKASEEA